jgi:hypothetical protein
MARRLAARTASPRKRPAPQSASHDDAQYSRSAEVVLDVDVDDDRVHLVLANCGDAVATDVRVEFSRPLKGLGGSSDISALPVFKGLGVLRPGRVLRIFWDSAPLLLGRDHGAPFIAHVSWNERSRPRQRAEYHHALSIYQQWPACLDRPESHDA